MREVSGAGLTRQQRFVGFCGATEPGLRRALVAAYGVPLGSEAAADALAWAWEHFERVETMKNPTGYLWRVGQSSVRAARRHRDKTLGENSSPMDQPDVDFEPALVGAMATLSPRQQAAVVLVHGYGYSLAEAAGLMACRIRTLRHHLGRGMEKLRQQLGVTDDE